MSTARFCDNCWRADNGSGQWRFAEYWDTEFLTKAVESINEFGGILHLKHCKLCLKAKGRQERMVARL